MKYFLHSLLVTLPLCGCTGLPNKVIVERWAQQIRACQASEGEGQVYAKRCLAAFVSGDPDRLTDLTYLALDDSAYRQTLAENPSKAVSKVRDFDLGVFRAEAVEHLRRDFEEVFQDSRKHGFEWASAEILSVRTSDEVEVILASNGVQGKLTMDDCFSTPGGVLAFGGPKFRGSHARN